MKPALYAFILLLLINLEEIITLVYRIKKLNETTIDVKRDHKIARLLWQ